MMGGVATTLREDMILERVLLYRRRKRALRLIFFFFKSISFSVSSILFSCCFEGKIECRDEGRIEN